MDFTREHVRNFENILANMRIIDHISGYRVDLPRVFMKLLYKGRHVANLIEDLSENGRYEVCCKDVYFGPYEYVSAHFTNNVHRAVLVVSERTARHTGLEKPSHDRIHRLVVMNVAHIVFSGQCGERYRNIGSQNIDTPFELRFGSRTVELRT